MFVPELSHIEEIMGCPVFVTTDGVFGVAYHMPIIDLEAFDLNFRFSCLERIIEALSPQVTLRVKTEYSVSTTLAKNARSSVVEDQGYLYERVFLYFELNRSTAFPFRRRKCVGNAATLFSLLPREDLKALDAEPLSEEQTRAQFLIPQSDVERHKDHLDFGTTVFGLIRLYKQGVVTLSEESLARLIHRVPIPFSITVTMKKVPRHTTELKLRSKLARQSVSDDPTSQRRIEETCEAINETALEGASQVQMEWLLTLERFSEGELRADLAKAISALKPLGDLMVETFACVPSFRATLPGSAQHFTFTEYDKASLVFLPAFAFGESPYEKKDPPKRALILHREDGSLHFFDQFSGSFLAYNAIISGKTGSGKSVLASALSQSLHSDPSITMVKIDVGGSYSKECEIYGGVETTFSLDRPSGINPFRLLAQLPDSNESIDILTKLLCTLVREEGETVIPRSLTVELGKELKAFAKAQSTDLSIDGFCRYSRDFPRKALLSRWCAGGVFENALRDKDKVQDNRYRYYNFESIQSAGNADYAEGVMAAVITQVNLEMLRLGRTGNRLVLFCDETKFFIEKNSSFFLLTTANFRKFGHGVILITQKVQNFELPSPTGKDSGIILNSPIRFFLEQDTERDYLKNTFRLSDSHLEHIVDSPYRGKDYREFVLQDDTGTRVVRLVLSTGEYWCVTSTREDNDKITALQKAVPGLTLQEAIQCISCEQLPV